ncbi:hypothetical protein RND71_002317 [Anisodus tanguticus]|uniref:Uncharacterized protein n=1 Tax=Anisodus tanguticus TaxID=243964 RepID=A0AAE1VYZ6_9SOLA|nr:hypothetical protein RND71_002317 [Anisodus tanguticus]
MVATTNEERLTRGDRLDGQNSGPKSEKIRISKITFPSGFDDSRRRIGSLPEKVGLQTYAPLRVLRQFGQEQIISLQTNMRVSEIQFELNFIIPELGKFSMNGTPLTKWILEIVK